MKEKQETEFPLKCLKSMVNVLGNGVTGTASVHLEVFGCK